MKQVALIFPDTIVMAEFIMLHSITNAEVNSRELSLTAVLSEDQIIKACTQFEAILRTEIINDELLDT